MRSTTLALCSMIVLGALVAAWARATDAKQSPKTVEAFLSAFADATADLDVERARSLFLPPDDSAEGQQRAAHIKELEKDWPRAKAKGESVALFFDEPETQRITITTTMHPQDGEESKLKAVPVEFVL